MSLPQRPPCWGIGLGRTGTTSFCDALRILGYERVRHNPRYDQLKLLEGGADIGVSLFYKYLDYKFPGSKFVLTVRDLESWLASEEYVLSHFPITSRDQDEAIMRRMLLAECVDFDREKLVRAYERHHDDVRRYFARRPGDLLEMNITSGDGWDVLCPFLGLEVPDVPFPSRNSRIALQQRS